MAPPKTQLSVGAIKAIEKEIDELFDRAKVRILGPQSVDKRIYVGFEHEFSLPGIFAAASRAERNIPNEETIKALLQNVGQYIDAYRFQTKAHVVKSVQSFLSEAAAKGIKTDLETVLGGQLSDVWAKTTSDLKRLVETEASNIRNTGLLEGIVKVNASQEIDDPSIYFVIVRDEHVCDECVRLHMLEDGSTPRVWKLSEVGHGYHKKGQPNPKVGGLHPNCRCTMVTILPGYGFKGGFVHYIGPGHDEYKAQRTE